MQREFSCGVLRAPVLRRAASERGDVNADEYCGEKEGAAFLGLKLRRERNARAPRENTRRGIRKYGDQRTGCGSFGSTPASFAAAASRAACSRAARAAAERAPRPESRLNWRIL